MHYGGIFDTTFMQTGFNSPRVLTVVVNTADLLDPLRTFGAITNILNDGLPFRCMLQLSF